MAPVSRRQGTRLGLIGLAVAAVLFLATNVFATVGLRGFQLDLTEGRLFSLSDGTRRTLAKIDDPIVLRLYFSKNLSDAAPRYAQYHARVREILERYAELADGRLRLEILDPEPFSDAEDRAVADGLQGVPVTAAGDLAYFGLAGDNATDGRAVIPFFNLEREPFLEYDLTKLVFGLSRAQLPKLGLLNGLPPTGAGMPGLGGPQGEPMIFNQLQDFFEVERLASDVATIPAGIDVLLVVDPARLTEDALAAVDTFVHGGGRALVLVDPNIESALGGGDGSPRMDLLAKLLAAWGLKLLPDKVAGDLTAARRVSTGGRGGVVADYLAWLSLGRGAFEAGDPIFANVERLNLASAGILEKVDAPGITVKPLLSTSPEAMAIDAAKVRFVPDIVQLLRDFKADGNPLMLAARVGGRPARAFAGAEDAKAEGTDAPPATAQADVPADVPADVRADVIVIADVDMLFDRFWVTATDFFGEQVLVPTANNADFVINAIESLSGSEALIGLRGRGTSYRPFTLIEAYRRDAEQQYRAKEEELQARLKDLQAQLKGIRRGGDGEGGEILLTADDKAAIERFRGEMLTVRRQLRDVQHALRQDIERLQSAVKAINIAAVPLLVCLLAFVVLLVRRRRRRSRGPATA